MNTEERKTEEKKKDQMLKKELKKERLQQKKERKKAAKKKARLEKDECGELIDPAALAETEYEVRDGVRCVLPYFYEHKIHAKRRWVGKSPVDVFVIEFGPSKDFYVAQAARAKFLVNGTPVQQDTVIQMGDTVTSIIHRHEPPVTAEPPHIISQDDRLVVVDKPSSIPVHPSGAFRHNSLTFLLAKEYGMNNLHCIIKLDRFTSGLMMFARSTTVAAEYMDQIQKGLTQKTYLARVDGRFPAGETLVDQPIEEIFGRGSRNIISPNGKPAQTHFRFVAYDEGSNTSVVLCKPRTGRTHQIRIHLAFLGFPISNDPRYNDALYQKKHWFLDDDENENVLPKEEEEEGSGGEQEAKEPTERDAKEDYCPWCAKKPVDPNPEDLVMWLHALSYEGPNWRYETPIPKWALVTSLDAIDFK